jgi:hypothetical protein
MSNLTSKLFVAALVSGAGLFGSLAIGSDAMALTGKKFYHEGKEYYCPDNYQPFRYDPNDPYYRYCQKHHDDKHHDHGHKDDWKHGKKHHDDKHHGGGHHGGGHHGGGHHGGGHHRN